LSRYDDELEEELSIDELDDELELDVLASVDELEDEELELCEERLEVEELLEYNHEELDELNDVDELVE